MKVLSLLCIAAVAVTLAYAQDSYSEDQAWNSLLYCKAAYCDVNKIASWTCESCGDHPNFQVKGAYNNGSFHGQCFTGYDPSRNQIVVSFRGSADFANWIADFDFFMMPYPDAECVGCQVHTGFFQVYQELAAAVLRDVSELLIAHPSAEVLVTGHSLGAAIAMHAGVDIARKISGAHSKTYVYNFGEPRLGNPAFAAWSAAVLPAGKQYRLTHATDPVPHLPPMDFGFLHARHELWYNNNGNTSFIHCNDTLTSEDPNCSDSIIPLGFGDHTVYLGICTGCHCADFDQEFYNKMQIVMPRTKSDRVGVKHLP
ncbi:lipase 3, putative [Bodo saltans]|uniref:Lipase 3, putative n=1 Tax=Bodo saltans TaxID=75058 RepID=A0A0S4J5D7_BODSA|nr:lipase 3, putative [Bodo saltans]|eukprot:CUG86636.1 lipase 3, putative [Bodo saltans]